MYTCPANDIHSLYADNELQEPFKTEFEIHTASCPECQKRLAAYRALSAKLREDSASFTFSAAELDESYMRLKARLSYKKNVLPQRRFSSAFFSASYPAVITAAAALFAFALIFPLKFFGAAETHRHTNIISVSKTIGAEPLQKRGIVTSESVNAASLASMLGTNYKYTLNTPQLTAQLTSVDVFKPQLSTGSTAIQIPLSSVAQLPLMYDKYTQTFSVVNEDPLR